MWSGVRTVYLTLTLGPSCPPTTQRKLKNAAAAQPESIFAGAVTRNNSPRLVAHRFTVGDVPLCGRSTLSDPDTVYVERRRRRAFNARCRSTQRCRRPFRHAYIHYARIVIRVVGRRLACKKRVAPSRRTKRGRGGAAGWCANKSRASIYIGADRRSQRRSRRGSSRAADPCDPCRRVGVDAEWYIYHIGYVSRYVRARALHPHQVHQRGTAVTHGQPAASTHVSSLYPEILALIFSYLDVRDKGRAAQVCTTWRDAAYYRSVWRGVEARLHLRKQAPALFASLVRRGVKKVQVLSLRRGLSDVLKGVPNLEALNLSGCYNITDSGITNAFCQEYPSLIELNLSLCKQVTDTSLSRIAQFLKNLEHLELGGCCNITNTGLLLIAWGLKKLKRLDLRSCWHVSDLGIAHLAGLNRETADGNLALEHLSLQDCQRLSDEALRHVSLGLTTLKSINLSFCVCITDSGVKHLARMSSLRELNLRSCDNISDIGMAYLAEGGSRITSLDVSFCDKIGDQALVHISQGLFNLKSLSLSACQISDEGICKIAKTLHDLETLNIGQCSRLTDRGLHTVAESMKNLKCIDLYGCTKITTSGLERIMKLPQLSDDDDDDDSSQRPKDNFVFARMFLPQAVSPLLSLGARSRPSALDIGIHDVVGE
ncbi:F-box/LRR-repeat protein 14 [Cyphomyrmex costatus]|uniref:F-box/LRR-repeat protein 14 n=1 Tax=Cyphomyrmex costatus TaxID=456900 RepID=A0A195D2Z4_9HYME|nr:F-box/LRR-repeat protein 14 [Cyphomyrmex costatus]